MSAAANGSSGLLVELSVPGKGAGTFTLSGFTTPICACAVIFQPAGAERRQTVMYRADPTGALPSPYRDVAPNVTPKFPSLDTSTRSGCQLTLTLGCAASSCWIPGRPDTTGAASQRSTASSVIARGSAAPMPVLNAAVLTVSSAARSDSRHARALSAPPACDSARSANPPISVSATPNIDGIFIGVSWNAVLR